MDTTYDDRPISMYDNLNMTNNVNTTSTPKTKPLAAAAAATTTTTTSSPPTSKSNGAAHSITPFADITFKFNDNNNTKQQQQQPPQQYQQQQQLNGNRNLNQIPPNAAMTTALYATPFKMANKPPILNKPAITQTPPATTAGIGNAPTTSSSPATTAAAVAAAAANSTANARLRDERPLSQHSQSELNETSHSIAAVKAALNEAKSKFFGLNGYAAPQHQYDPDESQTENLLPNAAATTRNDHSPRTQHHQKPQPHQLQLQQQPASPPQQVQAQKPQPKYQNIPENSALFRNPSGVVAPELPPKPLEYQNLNKTSQTPAPAKSTASTSPSPPPPGDQQNNRKMADGTIYNQISLNDIDGPSHRSQSVYMATTVPQNIKGNKIAGRHTPTRSSLRHSRMLVVSNKHYEEIQHPNPMGFRQPNLARWLLILQIIIGILLLSLSIWIFVLSPNTPIQDNPYWCGLVLLITGIIGSILIRYHRIKRDKTREHCFIFLRMDSYVLALLSLVLCCVALIFAAIHYCRITASDTKCESVHMLIEHGSCVCTFNAPVMNSSSTTTNSTETLAGALGNDHIEAAEEEIIDNSYKFEYRDLSCGEVTGPWTTILGLSFILSSVGFVISLAYVILLACCRSASRRSYTTVRTSTF